VPKPTFDAETTPETLNEAGVAEGATEPPGIGFVVLWAVDESELLGAWIPIWTGSGAGGRLLGRGPARPDDPYARPLILRQRPGNNESLPPFGSEALSRSQLLIRSNEADVLDVENLGRRKLFVNGRAVDRHEIRPGDVVEIGSRLALLCTNRPARLGGTAAPTHAFGRADAHGLVGESPAAWQLRAEIAFAARRTGHVLILGPTGSGKELVAGAVHALSGLPGTLVSRNAATLPETLVDTELFGNPKGYPNVGAPERVGLIGAAHRGSLFLDEFADLPSGAQSHILRVLDSGDYQKLGESQQRKSEFRLIAATNRPETSLRADLLARFDFRIRVPDLATRREDIPLLLCHLFGNIVESEPDLRERYCLANGFPRLDGGFVRRLVQHPFEANVRELRQLLWQSLAESSGNALEWPEQRDVSTLEGQSAEDVPGNEVQRVLDENNGSIEKTWRALGLANRYALRRLILKYGLTVRRRN
jgi:two-component system nitrogen regulation response regulator GlnG/two-component system response regulator HydG